ncbi:MAG: hypothetical protein H7840_13325 [Alphaproteobacteria bacterium]
MRRRRASGPVPEAQHPFLLTFRHALVDLVRIGAQALSAGVRLRVHLKARNALCPDLARWVEVILEDMAELDDVVVPVVRAIG